LLQEGCIWTFDPFNNSLNMKKISILFLALALVLINCQQEQEVTPQKEGKVTFSLSPIKRNGGRTNATATPAFVLLSMKDGNGDTRDNVKLPLFPFGQSYSSESLELYPGSFELTQFMVLDADNKIIYATPMEGSPLATYVTDALPINFTVTSDESTHVAPQVLAVTNVDEPESFGYTSFGFEVVNITALEIPSVGHVTKVSYVFVNGTEVITLEVASPSTIINLNNSQLLGKTWKAKVYIWTSIAPGDCYPKVYRYKGNLTFDGSLLKLPSFENQNWTHMLYYQRNFHNKVFTIFHSVDPRMIHNVEIHLPTGYTNFAGYADRYFWNNEGDYLCNDKPSGQYLSFQDVVRVNDKWVLDVSLPALDIAGCIPAGSGYAIDSSIGLNLNPYDYPNNLYFQNYFEWNVSETGILSPGCQNSNGRSASNHQLQGSRKQRMN
jgi:hypothetical protein